MIDDYNNIELNKDFKRVLKLMETTNTHLFITGKAGAGKSTLLSIFRNTTIKHPVLLAPTGVAAMNINGSTIHKFFRFPINVNKENVRSIRITNVDLYKSISMIVIDEISMVRADILDCIDIFLRKFRKNNSPFGGVQMVFVGDLYQLPPIVHDKERDTFLNNYETPYFFSSAVFKNTRVEVIELKKIYRQTDQDFIKLLNKIRTNSITQHDIDMINRSWAPYNHDLFNTITIASTNRTVDYVNNKCLKKLKTQLYTRRALIQGRVDEVYYPTVCDLQFKIGSQVMMLTNSKRGWVNGSLGVIEEIIYKKGVQTDAVVEFNPVEKDVRKLTNEDYDILYEKIYKDLTSGLSKEEEKILKTLSIEESIDTDTLKNQEQVRVRLYDSNKLLTILPHTWEIFEFVIENGKCVQRPIGSFTQYPFRLAWAITVHKSQGKTFDKVILDIGNYCFATGQAYVALSRCRSFEGISLKKPIKRDDVIVDPNIIEFFKNHKSLSE